MEYHYCIAQNIVYSPFVEEGKTWYMKYHNEESPEYPDYDYCHYIQGDTVIGGIECKKFYVFNYNNTQETEYLLAIFENNRKIYFIPKNMEKSFVLYDFDNTNGDIVSVTDAIHTDWKRDMKIAEERILNIEGKSRRCVLMQLIWEENPIQTSSGWWIEGIGSTLGPLNTWLFGAVGNNSYLQKCMIYEKGIFNIKDFKVVDIGETAVSTPEASDTSTAPRSAELRAEALFDLSGRRITGKPGRGVYIQGKRKVVIDN